MSEQRKGERHLLEVYLVVNDHVTGEYVGDLFDISDSGLMLIVEEPLPNDTIKDVSLMLPETLEKDSIQFQVRFKWCRPGTLSGYYNAGVALVDPTEEVTEILNTLIKDFNYSSLDAL